MIERPCSKRWEDLSGEGAVRHCAACDTAVVDTEVIPVRVARQLSRCLRVAALAALATPALASGERPEPAEKEVVVVVMGGIGSVREHVYFASGSAEVHQRHTALLDETANVLRDHPEIVSVAVHGHTDDKERPELGLKRAQAVIAELVKRGVEAKRMTAHSYEATRPLDERPTDDAREKNRRVDFEILEGG